MKLRPDIWKKFQDWLLLSPQSQAILESRFLLLPAEADCMLSGKFTEINPAANIKITQFIENLVIELSTGIPATNRSPSELKVLSSELREKILATCTSYLDSNISVVELTVAIYNVFNSSVDMVFINDSRLDCAQKIILGQNSSDADQFEGSITSHVRDYAMARDRRGGQGNIVLVLAEESFNECAIEKILQSFADLASSTRNLIVIFNEDCAGSQFREQIPQMLSILEKSSSSIQRSNTNQNPSMVIFETLGFQYIGPVDGHDLDSLDKTMNALKNLRGSPILLHAITEVPSVIRNSATPKKTPDHYLFPEELLSRVSRGDLAALEELDQQGFLMAPAETPRAFSDRLLYFQIGLARFKHRLKVKGFVEIDINGGENLKLVPESSIPQEHIDEVAGHTQKLYGFAISWVPGFYANYGLLFGGTTITWPADHFSVFLLRSSMLKQPRWMIYDRREILAHELCHVARSPLMAHTFEETFAYGTSSSAFRRYCGGALKSIYTTYILVALLAVCIFIQSFNTFVNPPQPGDPIFPASVLLGFCLPLLFIAFLGIRQGLDVMKINRLRRSLADCCEHPDHLLFRLSDAEIIELSTSLPRNRKEWEAALIRLGSSPKRAALLAARVKI